MNALREQESRKGEETTPMMTKGKGEYRCYYSNKGSGGGAGAAAIKGRSSGVCVTKEEIAKYWRRKKMEEEEHLFSAVKAAARIKSRTLTVSLIGSKQS